MFFSPPVSPGDILGFKREITLVSDHAMISAWYGTQCTNPTKILAYTGKFFGYVRSLTSKCINKELTKLDQRYNSNVCVYNPKIK